MNKLTVELTVDEADLLVGALGAFLAENEAFIKQYQNRTDTTEQSDEFYLYHLSENATATELLHKFGFLIGWTDTQLREFLEIIQRELNK